MNHGELCHKANDETLISKEENGFPTMGRASLPRGRRMAGMWRTIRIDRSPDAGTPLSDAFFADAPGEIRT